MEITTVDMAKYTWKNCRFFPTLSAPNALCPSCRPVETTAVDLRRIGRARYNTPCPPTSVRGQCSRGTRHSLHPYSVSIYSTRQTLDSIVLREKINIGEKSPTAIPRVQSGCNGKRETAGSEAECNHATGGATSRESEREPSAGKSSCAKVQGPDSIHVELMERPEGTGRVVRGELGWSGVRSRSRRSTGIVSPIRGQCRSGVGTLGQLRQGTGGRRSG